MIYIGIAAALFLLRLLTHGQPRLIRQLYIVALLFLFLFSAFRFEVGCDWTGYMNQYAAAAISDPGLAFEHPEALWWLILWAQNELGLPYPWINVLSSAICFAGVHVLARRQPDPFAFLILLFPILIINMPMSGIRQGAAIGLMCIALARLFDGRMLAFVFWVLVAAQFHSSAAIFLLITPLVSRKITRWRVLMAAVLAIPGVLLLLTSQAAETATQRYMDGGADAFGAMFRIGLLMLSALYFFFFLRAAWKREFPAEYPIIWGSAFAMLIMGALLPVSSIIADRLAYFLIPIQALIFARIPWFGGLSGRKMLAALPYIGLLIFFVTWTIMSSLFETCYLPYQSWLFGSHTL